MLDRETAIRLFKEADLLEIGRMADDVKKSLHPEGVVTFIVDRNINYTNICINRCRFCAYYRDAGASDAFVLSMDDLFRKIEETLEQGGTQILLQGGLNQELDLNFYIDLLRSIKDRFNINIHGFSPPEIRFIADRSGLTVSEAIGVLRDAGLDSIPGGGAEILSDRVREVLSPRKIRTSEWLEVMEEAHNLGMRTTATMMFGSIEGPEDIVEHLDVIRRLQDKTGGFTAFIPWSFQPNNTELIQDSKFNTQSNNSSLNIATAVDYLRVLAISRLYLYNIRNIQASWVTQGLKMAQVALRFGANDFGSTMIEENVVRAAGISYRVTRDDIINGIRGAGFVPAQRDTYYNILRYFDYTEVT